MNTSGFLFAAAAPGCCTAGLGRDTGGFQCTIALAKPVPTPADAFASGSSSPSKDECNPENNSSSNCSPSSHTSGAEAKPYCPTVSRKQSSSTAVNACRG